MNKFIGRKQKGIFCGVILALVLGCFPFSARAEDIRFQAEVDRNVIRLGEAVQLTLRVSGTQDVPPIKLPDIEGFETSYAGGPYKQFSWVNGRSTSSASYKYSLFPTKTGQFVIPSLTLTLDGNSYTSDAITIKVSDGQAATPPSGQGHSSAQAPSSIEDKMFLHLEVPRTDVYLNEVVPVKVLLLVSGIRLEYGEVPEFSNEGIRILEAGDSRQYQTMINGVRYNVVEFDLKISASRLGELTLGPAQLGTNIVVPSQRRSVFNDSFFGDSLFGSMFDTDERVPRTLRSNPVTLNVLSVPEEGKPKNFSGGVGQFAFDASIGPDTVKVGDPITLKMKITGSGDLDAVKFPDFPESKDFKTYEPILNAEAGIRTRGLVIIPKNDSIDEVPAVTFSYFDTKEQKYKTITRGPFPVTVNPLPEGEELKVVGLGQPSQSQTPEVLGHDMVYLKDSLGHLQDKGSSLLSNVFVYLFILLILAAWGCSLVYFKRTHKLNTDVVYAKKMRAPIYARKGLKDAEALLKSGKSTEFYDIVFKTFQIYLANKLHLPKGSVDFASVKQSIGNQLPQPKVLEGIRIIFEECDRVRYSSVAITEKDMETSYQRLQYVIDYMESHLK